MTNTRELRPGLDRNHGADVGADLDAWRAVFGAPDDVSAWAGANELADLLAVTGDLVADAIAALDGSPLAVSEALASAPGELHGLAGQVRDIRRRFAGPTGV